MAFLSKLAAGAVVTSSTAGIGAAKLVYFNSPSEDTTTVKTSSVATEENSSPDLSFTEDEIRNSSSEEQDTLQRSEETVDASVIPVADEQPKTPPKCQVFLIQQESRSTVKTFQDWESRKESDLKTSKNRGFWDLVDKACERDPSTGGKVYVSTPKPSKALTYSESHQKK